MVEANTLQTNTDYKMPLPTRRSARIAQHRAARTAALTQEIGQCDVELELTMNNMFIVDPATGENKLNLAMCRKRMRLYAKYHRLWREYGDLKKRDIIVG